MSRLRNALLTGASSIALAALLAVTGHLGFTPRPAARNSTPAVPASWWEQVQQRIASEEYFATAQPGGLQAPNRAQGLRTHFGNEALEVVPRTGEAHWRLEWRTTAWGRGEALRTPAAAVPQAREARVEYARGPLVEWYENRPEGLEQGFTIAARPSGEGELRVRGRLESDGLAPKLAAGGGVISLRDLTGAEVLRYSALVARDAGGRELPSRLEQRRSDIDLVVDDTGAHYPVTIDPLLATPSWTHEGDAASAQYGYSVATAGDVNHDGFSDLIVGAPVYDNGGVKAWGRVFVYIGGANGPPLVANWEASVNDTGDVAKFGQCVASAGDLNGDGYDDIVVGAPEFSSKFSDTSEGFAFVWYGGPSGGAGGSSGLGAFGTMANADWYAQANQTDANLGYSVAHAGDLNGDGYADLVVGAPSYTNGQQNEGRVFVWMGSATGLGAFGTPENADWIAESDAAQAHLGWSVAGAGDVNADGYDDLLVGAPVANAALMWLGDAAGLGAIGTPFNADWSANGTQAGAQLGYSVATAGDVNGDGYGDVIVGAPRYDNPAVDEGEVFVWLGGPDDLGANGNPVNADWSYDADMDSVQVGFSVATAGDLNGDGFADIVVGGPGYSGGQVREGLALAFQGSATGPGALPVWLYASNETLAQLGSSVATAGDVNGDGFSDIVVGAFAHTGDLANEGQALLFYGYALGPQTVASWLGEKNIAGAGLGTRVAPAGDINADGYSDVLVSAPNYDGGNVDEGRVYLFIGQSLGLSINHAWSAEGNQTGAFFGSCVASAGDVNNDGFDDVLIGASGYDSGALIDNGAVFLWRGSAAGLGVSGTPANAAWRYDGTQASEYVGQSAAGAGDVNGDGFSDVIVGGYGWSNGQAGEGHVLAFHGGTLGLGAAPAWTVERNQAGMRLGYAVAGAGDVNADGFSDVIVSAPLYSSTAHTNDGRAYVFQGSATGLPAGAVWTGTGGQDFGYFGHSVATAGDVNGDGYSDVIVGAYGYDGDQADEGRVFVYHGSSTGPGVAAAWTAESNQSNSRFGIAVSTGGDVNGDGYSDVLVGADAYVVAGVSTGRAFLWLGSGTGLGANGSPLNDDWTDDGSQIGAQDGDFGASVACAGDVDGDGFSDILVGAPLADDGEADEGVAYMFYGNSSHGMDRAIMQRRHDDAGRVGLLGFSSSETAFRIRALARSAGGRGRTRLEYEFRTLGGPFTPGNGSHSANWTDTGVPGAQGSVVPLNDYVSFAPNGGVLRWRARVATDSPLFPHGPWLSIPGNGRTEGDIRLLHGVLAVEPSAPAALAFALAGANPFRNRMPLRFSLPSGSRVRLEVLDVSGRRVTTLMDRDLPAGTHEASWDARDDAGGVAAPGVYFARLRAGSLTRVLKVVRAF